MKIICNTFEIRDAVLNVQRAVSSKSSLPALEGILLKTQGDKLVLSGYDLEIAIKTEINANIINEGAIVLNAKLLAEIIKKVTADKVQIEIDSKLNATISSGSSEFTIMAIDAAEFPELPAIDQNENISINCDVLKSMVSQTIFAVSTSDIKPVHTGILFEINNDSLKLVAVDGYRLAIRQEKIENDTTMKFVVPAKTLNEIVKLIGDEDETIQLNVGSRHISFIVSDFLVVSRLLEGEFLDYKTAIPSGATANVIINTRDVIEAVERISLLITDRIKSPVRCTFSNNKADLRCTTSMGRASDSVECKIDGEALEIGFNNKYFLDAVRAVDCDIVKLELNGPTSPIRIIPTQGDNFLFLVLPVRLKSE